MLRARTPVDAMGKWIEFELPILDGSPLVSGRIVNTYICTVDYKNTGAPASSLRADPVILSTTNPKGWFIWPNGFCFECARPSWYAEYARLTGTSSQISRAFDGDRKDHLLVYLTRRSLIQDIRRWAEVIRINCLKSM